MYKLNEEKMFYDIADGQAVVINFETGMYYGTGTLGSAVLDNLVNGASYASVAAALHGADGCPADIDGKLAAFLDALLGKEILVEAEGEGGEASFAPAAFADGFEMAVDEFAEVQDLLLADPVHEVDVEKGWPILKDE